MVGVGGRPAGLDLARLTDAAAPAHDVTTVEQGRAGRGVLAGTHLDDPSPTRHAAWAQRRDLAWPRRCGSVRGIRPRPS